MLIITEKIRKILKEKSLSENKLAQMINYHSGSLNKMITGKKPFPEDKIQKIIPVLEVSQEEFEGWILADKYPKDILERVIQLKKEKSSEDKKLILTTKLDKILKAKDLSRTGLSKLINYSQGSLNEKLIGKAPMSKGVIHKVSIALEIPENEIRSWIVADKYSLETFEEAVTNF